MKNGKYEQKVYMGSEKPPTSGIEEAEAFVIVKFHLEKSNGTFTVHEADCLVNTEIGGLKEDLEDLLGPPETQTWFYNECLLSDQKRMMDFGIDGSMNIRILVKNCS